MRLANMTKSTNQHTPQRTCVACRQVRPKRELIRLVRLPSGSVEIDVGTSKAGRGGYLCRRRECWEVGLQGNRLEYTLRTKITSDNRDSLLKQGKDLLGEYASGKNG
jgi:predicted RNA-binding protein YlxR (DUF448 family)